MRKRIFKYSIFLILFSIYGGYSQEHTITGIVIDETTGQPLDAATVYLESTDNNLITYSISNQQGEFELVFTTRHNTVNFYISYSGYAPVNREIRLDKPEIDLGKLLLKIQVEELEGVEIIGERVPVTIKKDTLEFNADSFKTRPDANVEELLKQLPGIEVDSNGKILVNGKEVNNVLVNGKPFFGNDPTIATKNLPKEIVDKIQITDTKTETEEFTGKQSTSDTKTVNITIKEDKNKGYFGRLTAGYGTDERYQLSGITNYFNDAQRFSLLASANNINSPGFSFDEIYDMVGGGRGRGGRRSGSSRSGAFSLASGFGEGITTSSNIGGSFTDTFKDKTEVSADYFYSNSNSYNDTKLSRENILPDESYFVNSTTGFNGVTDSHKVTTRFEFEIDSTFKIILSPQFGLTQITSENTSQEVSLNDNGELINRGEANNRNHTEEKSFSNELEAIKKLSNRGHYIKIGFRNSNNINAGTNFINNENEVYGDNAELVYLNQIADIHTRSDSWLGDIEFRQPLADNLFLDLSYSYNSRNTHNERIVNDYEQATSMYTAYNASLSSDFNTKNNQQRPEVGLNFETDKWVIGFNAGWVNTTLKNNDRLQNLAFLKTFDNVLFGGNINYNFGQRKRIRFDYNASLNIPSATQLQPINDVSDPLNTISGNPNLEPGISHNFYINYNNYDWKNRSGIFIYGNGMIQKSRIINSTFTDEDYLRRTTFVNVDGNYSASLGASWSKQIKKDSLYTLRLQPGINSSFNNNVSLNNGVEFTAQSFMVTPSVRINYNYKEVLEISPSYSIMLNTTSYSLDRFDNASFTTHNASLRTTTFWPKNVIWGNDITYSYNGNVRDNFDKSAVFWNMSLGVNVFNDSGILKVLAYDLLNQNINTVRVATEDYIQDAQGTVLQQYFMLSFTWKFDKFGLNKNKGRRGYIRANLP